ncbi:FKBP-type peptidyl-prolyl cis-trans isomerase [Thalassotalea sp. ND16A]|uniref:FKBP-type peptidyl-prolyl cis-trans isomerase n=1 Tax=Thalassotalea sp. ND16A TaxID=1535422 RepID=UPI000519F1B2|nr:FKBP-type peptidyl-prolyl cis-trans isomerase [Thalassotalea sp. ND16A]KGJ92170.1 Peptidylprolyl isomerase [Thalassotalea sp. ND16A]
MKFFVKPTLVAVAVMAMMGCQEETTAKAVTLETEDQKQAYALGASIGSYMNNNLTEQEKFGIVLDKDLLMAGFTESLNGKAQIEKEEIQKLLMALDQKVNEKKQEQTAIATEKNIADGVAFLAENAKVEGVQTTESGLQYQVLTAAEGAKPMASDTVKVHYKGTLTDGTTFDSSYDRGEPIEFPLNRVIKGWTEGVQLMNVGSKYKFVIPSDLAYGPSGTGPIPGNATLVFEVELLEIIAAAAPKAEAEAAK